MADKTKKPRVKDETPVYKVEKAKGGAGKVAKIMLPRMSVNDIHDQIDAMLDAIRKDGKTVAVVKGVLTCY